jgi:2-keto-4-pentenoate hydratase/2-oxohepta-3-ene-1,7-dioic acid hydratase in catechol pathway
LTSRYKHRWIDAGAIDLPLGKIVCVGRNYAAHARELNHPIPSRPLLFIKPATALAPLEAPLVIPRRQGAVHFELEVALLIGRQLDSTHSIDAVTAIAGIGLALDLTLRDVQAQLKDNGLPWEIAKGFDGACPCSMFAASGHFPDPGNIDFTLELNGVLRQTGNTGAMLFPMEGLLQEMATHFTLLPGDIVLTGTPEGVGALQPGDRLRLKLADQLAFDTHVAD